MIARHIEETEIQMNVSACDKTTWVLVKDELWLFLENQVLGLATGQTLNSQGWNYLKRRAGWCTWHLSLKECLLFPVPQISIWGNRTKGLVYLWIRLWKINRRMLQKGKRMVSENEFCNISSEFTVWIWGRPARGAPWVLLFLPSS